MSNTLKLPIESLKLHVNLSDFELPTTPPRKTSILGQPRAQAAFEFGIAMTNPGYNIFVMGDPGLGRLTMVTDHLNAIAQTLPAPPTYAYVDNFSNSREPLAIELPAEYGQTFSKDIEKLIDNLLATFPAAFESPAYQQKKMPSSGNLVKRITMLLTRLMNKPNQSTSLCSKKVKRSPLRRSKTKQP